MGDFQKAVEIPGMLPRFGAMSILIEGDDGEFFGMSETVSSGSHVFLFRAFWLSVKRPSLVFDILTFAAMARHREARAAMRVIARATGIESFLPRSKSGSARRMIGKRDGIRHVIV
jgi:hypothetical protein